LLEVCSALRRRGFGAYCTLKQLRLTLLNGLVAQRQLAAQRCNILEERGFAGLARTEFMAQRTNCEELLLTRSVLQSQSTLAILQQRFVVFGALLRLLGRQTKCSHSLLGLAQSFGALLGFPERSNPFATLSRPGNEEPFPNDK
jgi:hypothetical protein